MVVDDNPDVLYFTGVLLDRITDNPVELFNSPQAALGAFFACPGKYGLVITDFEMPGLNGAELCRSLRKMVPALKVVLMTGSNVTGHSAVTDLGFRGFLPKPFTLADLKNALAAAGLFGEQAPADSTIEPDRFLMA